MSEYILDLFWAWIRHLGFTVGCDVPVSDNQVPMTRYDRWVHATTGLLDGLAWLFLADFFFGWLVPPQPNSWWEHLSNGISWGVWLAFAIDYVVRFTLAPKKWPFVKAHPFDLLMVLLPMLRVIRVVLLLRKSLANISTEKIASSLFLLIGTVVALGALIEWRFEHAAKGANITTIGDAFWWSIVTTTTVGYGDEYPVTAKGRLTAAVVMLVGIGLIGIVSASVASWFVARGRKKDTDATSEALEEAEQSVVQLTSQIASLQSEQAEMKAMIQQLLEARQSGS